MYELQMKNFIHENA
jgi:hypothetical protein